MLEAIATSWLRTRRAMRWSAPRLAGLRERQWARLQPALARTPALAPYAGQPLEHFPITDIATLRRDYGAWNSLGLSDTALRALADAAEEGDQTSTLSAGWSTGSGGGTRGLFVASAAERADYIGQSLAVLLPPSALLHRQRIALHLRAGNALYSDAGRGCFAFAHVPLAGTAEQATIALRSFAPTVVIAPPHRLLAFAQGGLHLPSLRHLFCGSEPISPAERAVVAAHFGLAPRAIWQATEGFLGAECASGRWHLNDHALTVELEPVPGTPGFRPIITDLRRTSQPVVRLRGDDYLELDGQPCPCGFAGRVMHPLAGRVGDLWPLPDRCLTPAQVVAAVESELGGTRRWQAQAGCSAVILRVAPECPLETARTAANALTALAGRPVALRHDLPEWPGPKRHKVVWRND